MGGASPLGIVSWVNELLQRHQELFFLYSDNPVWHLLLVVAALGLLFLLRLRRWTRRIERARARIPLSIGGWGTRGKSGTARKKSALLHALGLEVFTKTTGCEAMVIHALPDRPALELFLYRPYDKATIWEQKDVLGIAADTEPHVFLYECMALNPRYVEIIAQQWMRDDVATITNTYPDHEDIQGPRGIDLPQVMARFLPRNAPCFTAEHTMRPILEDAARRWGCRLEGVGWREAAMIPDDVLARYPYRVHPMNLALVTRLGESLGIEREFAWKEIADWIVPDLGVLKVFPEARHRGRRLTFSNGHSANERHGFNANWKRLGLDRFDARAEPGRWLVTVVNNRGDRIARSKVFADCMVHDVRVHRHLLIGTNLTGLRGYVEASLERRLAGLRLLPDGPIEDGAAARREAHERLEQQLAYLCWEVREPADVVEKLRCMLQGLEIEPAVIERWCGDRSLCEAIEGSRLRCVEIDPLSSGAAAGRDLALDEALASLETSLVRDAGLDPGVAHAVASWLERWTRELGTLRALRRVIDDLLSAPPTASSRAQLDELLRSFVRRAFLDKLHALEDPTASGDRVVDFVARACPPGLAVHVHGAQNIKGPGLDWCYRWIGLERVREQVAALRDRSAERRRQALAWLGSHTDYGLLDAPVAIEAIEAARSEPRNQDLAFQNRAELALQHVRAAYRAALARLDAGQHPRSRWRRVLDGAIDRALGFVEKLLDAGDAKRRRARADAILRDLADGRIAHARAAARLREIVARQKGGWLKKAIVKRWRALMAQIEGGAEPPAVPPGGDERTRSATGSPPVAASAGARTRPTAAAGAGTGVG